MLWLSLSLSFMIGIFLSGYLTSNIPVFVFFYLCLVLFVVIHGMMHTQKRKNFFRIARCLLLCLTVGCLGIGTYHFYTEHKLQTAERLVFSEPEEISGVIVGDVTRYGDTACFYLKLKDQTLLSVTVHTQTSLYRGQNVTLSNPTLTLVNKENTSNAKIKKMLGNTAFVAASFPYRARVTVNGIGNPVLYGAARARLMVKNRLNTLCSKEVSGFLNALISSDKSSLSEELYQSLIETGTVHIVVVSGLHFNYLMMILLGIFHLVFQSHRKRLLCALPCLVLFCLFTGGTLPVLRSAIMMLCATVCDLFYTKRRNSRVVLILLATAFLLFEPTLIHNPSFLLTFTASLGIVCFQMPLEYRLRLLRPEWLRSIVALTFSVQVFTLPTVLFCFTRFSPVSVIANLLISPLVAPILFLVAGVLLLGFLPGVCQLLLWAVHHLVSLFLWLITFLEQHSQPLSFRLWELPYLLLIGVGICFYFYLTSKKSTFRTLAGFLIISLLCHTAAVWKIPSEPGVISVEFLGASNTNSAVITTGGNRRILYGSLKDLYRGKSSGYFDETSYIPMMILTDLSNPEYLEELLKTHQIETVILPKKFQSSLLETGNIQLLENTVSTRVDNLSLRLVADKNQLYEAEFSYGRNTFSFSEHAEYLAEHFEDFSNKTWIYNFRRTGKYASSLATMHPVSLTISKKNWHPDTVCYDNFSMLKTNGHTLWFVGNRQQEAKWISNN